MVTSIKSVSKPLFLTKSIFFVVYAAASVLLPFMALFYEQRGFTGSQIGLLAGIPPIMTMLGASVWGGLADLTHRYKLIFILVMAGAMGTAVLTPLVSSFAGLSLIIAVHSFCFMSLLPLIDNTALDILGSQSDRYGQVRLWGSLGWGLGAPVIGPLVERLGLEWTFYGHAALILVGLLIALPLPVATTSGNSAFGQGLKKLLQDRRWYVFLLIIFVAGFGDAIIRNYWFLYLKDISASSTMMGLSLTIGMVSELAVLFSSGYLFRRFGTRTLLVLGASTQAVRLLGWSFIDEPYAALSLQLLNGLAFGTLWMAGVAYAKEIAPAGLRATAQGLLSGVYFGFSSVVGAVSGGFLYEQVGSWGMFRWGAVIMIIGLLLFAVVENVKVRATAKQPVKLA